MSKHVHISISISTCICTPIQTLLGLSKRKEIGGACSMYGGEERCTQGVWWGNLRERNYLEDVRTRG